MDVRRVFCVSAEGRFSLVWIATDAEAAIRMHKEAFPDEKITEVVFCGTED